MSDCPVEPEDSVPSTGKMGFSMLRALRSGNYRLFFAGQAISVLGSFMQMAALGWLVYKLEGKPFLLGATVFATQIPVFLLGPLAGVLADRVDKRRLLVALLSLAACQATALSVLTFTGVIEVWHILALGSMAGLVSAFEIPTRQSFVVQMVSNKNDLPNAIALNSFLINGGKLIGPSLGGLLIAGVNSAAGDGQHRVVLGEAVCFAANAVSFLAVIVSLLRMRLAPHIPSKTHPHILRSLKEGFDYAWQFKPIRVQLLLTAVVSLMALQYNTLVPIFARDILRGDSTLNGLLLSAPAIGALIGATYMASRRNALGLAEAVAVAPLLLGAALIGFGLSHNWLLSVALMVPVGLGQMIQVAGANTLLQTIVDDDKRGRVMSFHAMSFMGMGPFGALLLGTLAQKLGAPTTLVLSGGAAMAAALAFLFWLPAHRRLLAPVYERLGISPRKT